jgi:hypothetical protein
MLPTKRSTQKAHGCDAGDKNGKKRQGENTPFPRRKRLRVVADTPAIAATKPALFSLMGELNRFL